MRKSKGKCHGVFWSINFIHLKNFKCFYIKIKDIREEHVVSIIYLFIHSFTHFSVYLVLRNFDDLGPILGFVSRLQGNGSSPEVVEFPKDMDRQGILDHGAK